MTGKQVLLWVSFAISLVGLFRMILSDPEPLTRAPEGADAEVVQEFGRAAGITAEP